MSGFAPLTDTTTGRSSKWDATGSSAHVNLTTLISGENQTLNVLEVINGASEYETVAASQTDQVMGAVGAAGDYLGTLLVIIGTGGAGATLTVKDNATTLLTFAFLTAPATPIEIPINAKSVSGAWKISTGTTVTVLAKGLFS